jgi:hypothetical protein
VASSPKVRRGRLISYAKWKEILATWREIERALELAEPGSAAFERLASHAALLRDEYQRLVDLAQPEQGTRSGLQPSG